MRKTDAISLQLIFAPLNLFAPCRLHGIALVELLSLYDIKAKQMQPLISESTTWLRSCFTQVPLSIMKQSETWVCEVGGDCPISWVVSVFVCHIWNETRTALSWRSPHLHQKGVYLHGENQLKDLPTTQESIWVNLRHWIMHDWCTEWNDWEF